MDAVNVKSSGPLYYLTLNLTLRSLHHQIIGCIDSLARTVTVHHIIEGNNCCDSGCACMTVPVDTSLVHGSVRKLAQWVEVDRSRSAGSSLVHLGCRAV